MFPVLVRAAFSYLATHPSFAASPWQSKLRIGGALRRACYPKSYTFESVHISAYVIYAVAIQETFNLFIEFASGLVRGEGYSITLELGI
jgi:hypothetical protein